MKKKTKNTVTKDLLVLLPLYFFFSIISTAIFAKDPVIDTPSLVSIFVEGTKDHFLPDGSGCVLFCLTLW